MNGLHFRIISQICAVWRKHLFTVCKWTSCSVLLGTQQKAIEVGWFGKWGHVASSKDYRWNLAWDIITITVTFSLENFNTGIKWGMDISLWLKTWQDLFALSWFLFASHLVIGQTEARKQLTSGKTRAADSKERLVVNLSLANISTCLADALGRQESRQFETGVLARAYLSYCLFAPNWWAHHVHTNFAWAELGLRLRSRPGAAGWRQHE